MIPTNFGDVSIYGRTGDGGPYGSRRSVSSTRSKSGIPSTALYQCLEWDNEIATYQSATADGILTT